jgi:Xaa-Pro dipeptidase
VALKSQGIGLRIDYPELRETRLILWRTLFTIKAGVYLPDFGVRSEIDIHADGTVAVTGGPMQTEIAPILRNF